jgi:NUMOD4 motif-containing protein/HNH endonuclease
LKVAAKAAIKDNFMREIWKTCFDGFYEVSNLGRIRRAKAGQGTKIGRLLKPSPQGQGYLYVSIFGKRIPVAKIVAEAFHGSRPKGFQINHRDLNRINNCSKNLEYKTGSKNIIHAIRKGIKWGLANPVQKAKQRARWEQWRKKRGWPKKLWNVPKRKMKAPY